MRRTLTRVPDADRAVSSTSLSGHPVRAPQIATSLGDQQLMRGQRRRFGHGGFTAWEGERRWRESYYSNVWVYRCGQVIAEDLATLPLRVGADPSMPGDYDVNHPLAVLLGPPPGSPNPETSARSLWLWTVVQRLITGAFAWEIELGPNTGLPMFLWPIPSVHVTPVPSDGGARYFDAYDVGIGRDKQRLSRDRMVYDHRPSATDWREPESVLEAAHLDVSVAVMQDRYDFAFLVNDARPAAVVVHEAYNSVEERDAWRRSFVATHGGPHNAGKIEFVETTQGGAKPSEALLVQTLGLSQKDAEFIARYEAKLRAIEVAFGVPRSRLGDASARTYANASEEWGGYWRTTIKNLALELSDAINTKLAPRFGQAVCWFDFSQNEWLRDEPPFPVEQAVELQKAGIVTLNDVRTKVLYLPPVDGGDMLRPTLDRETALLPADALQKLYLAVQSNVITVEEARMIATMLGAPFGPTPPPELDVPAADDAAGQEPEMTDTDTDGEDGTGENDELEAVAASSVALLDARRQARQQQRELAAAARHRRMLYRQIDTSTERLERRWEQRWQRFFTQQRDSVIARLEGKRGRQAVRQLPGGIDNVFDRAFWLAQTTELTVAMFEDVVSANGMLTAATFGVEFDVESLFVQDFIQQRANQLSGPVNQTTYDGITRQLSEGVAAGEDIPTLSKRIRTLFTQTYKNRATTVARTEVISAFNGSTALVANTLPDDVVAGMEWLATNDARTRDAHAEADGQRVATGQSFQVGGESLQYPGDPAASAKNIVNCRCAVVPITLAQLAEAGVALVGSFGASE